jgi:hypothetical protein
VLNEDVPGEERSQDGVHQRWHDAVTALDGIEREVGLVAAMAKVAVGPAFGLGVGSDARPSHAVAPEVLGTLVAVII